MRGFLCHDAFDYSPSGDIVETSYDTGHRVRIEQDLTALESGGVWYIGSDFKFKFRRNHSANHADHVLDFCQCFGSRAIYGRSNVLFRNFLYDRFGLLFSNDVGFNRCRFNFSRNLSRANCIIDRFGCFGNLIQGSGCGASDTVDQTSRSHRSAENGFFSKVNDIGKRFLVVRLLRPSETKHIKHGINHAGKEATLFRRRQQGFQESLEICAGKEMCNELINILKPVGQSRICDSVVRSRTASQLKNTVDPLKRSALGSVEVLVRAGNGDANKCVGVLMEEYINKTASVVSVQVDRDHRRSIGRLHVSTSILERRLIQSELDLSDVSLILQEEFGEQTLVRVRFGRGDCFKCFNDGLRIVGLQSKAGYLCIVLLACVSDLFSANIGARPEWLNSVTN